jgi:glycosyltransferase involved in cell wall biosynthesis
VTGRHSADALRVLIFAHSSSDGGAEAVLEELVAGLCARPGVQCRVVLPNAGPMYEALEDHGAETVRLDYDWWCAAPGDPRLEAGADRLAVSLARVECALPALADPPPDVVLTNTLTIPWGAVTANAMGLPHVWLVQEYGRDDHGLEFCRPFTEIVRLIDEASSHVVVVTRTLRETLFPDLGEERISVSAYAIPLPGPVEGAPQYFERPGALKVALVGRVSRTKGQDDAVRAVARLTQDGRDVELCLAGLLDPEAEFVGALLRSISEKGLEDRVHVLGYVDDSGLVVRQADVALMCSRKEAAGRVTMEAMLLGTPVVGTDSGGTAELIQDGVDGFLYAPSDDAMLAEKLAWFIDHPDEAARLGEAARESITAWLATDRYDERVFEVCRRLAGGPPAQSAAMAELVEGWRGGATAALVRKLDAARALAEERTAWAQDLERLLERTIAQDAAELATAKQAAAVAEARLRTIRGSSSWRLTAPLRAARRRTSRKPSGSGGQA